MGEEGLDVAAAHEVQLLLLAALVGEAAARLRHEASAQRAGGLVEVEALVAALLGELGRGGQPCDGLTGGATARRVATGAHGVLHLRVHVLLGEGEVGVGGRRAEGLEVRVDGRVGGASGVHVGREPVLVVVHVRVEILLVLMVLLVVLRRRALVVALVVLTAVVELLLVVVRQLVRVGGGRQVVHALVDGLGRGGRRAA